MKYKLELYGRLRDSGLGSSVTVDLPRGGAVLVGCVLASSDEVLSSTDVLPTTGRLALLPPVCGG